MQVKDKLEEINRLESELKMLLSTWQELFIQGVILSILALFLNAAGLFWNPILFLVGIPTLFLSFIWDIRRNYTKSELDELSHDIFALRSKPSLLTKKKSKGDKSEAD